MAKLEIFSKDDNLLAVVDSDYYIIETHVYIPAIDSWHEITDKRVTELAEKLVQEYIEENEIKLDESNDDFKSQSYKRFVSNY
jgi:hypothetical protein